MRNFQSVQIRNRRSEAPQNVTRFSFAKTASIDIGVELLSQITAFTVFHNQNGHWGGINAVHFDKEGFGFDGQTADDVLVFDTMGHVVDFAVPSFDGDFGGSVRRCWVATLDS